MGGLKLNFNFEKIEERPIEYAKLSSKGQGVGAIVAMETEFHLKPDGERTHMDWVADVRVAGPIGSMGQRVFQPIVNQQVGNVLDALEEQVAEAKGGGTSGAEEGIHAASPEAYEAEPDGPTHSTDG
jgi:carbon monoxide dehydrogenase subunit G